MHKIGSEILFYKISEFQSNTNVYQANNIYININTYGPSIKDLITAYYYEITFKRNIYNSHFHIFSYCIYFIKQIKIL